MESGGFESTLVSKECVPCAASLVVGSTDSAAISSVLASSLLLPSLAREHEVLILVCPGIFSLQCFYLLLVIEGMGDGKTLETWVSDELHGLVGYAQGAVVQYVIGFGKSSSFGVHGFLGAFVTFLLLLLSS